MYVNLNWARRALCALLLAFTTDICANETRQATVSHFVLPNWLHGDGAQFPSIFLPEIAANNALTEPLSCSALSYTNVLMTLCCNSLGQCSRSTPKHMDGTVNGAAGLKASGLGFDLAVTGTNPRTSWVDFVTAPKLHVQRRWPIDCRDPHFAVLSSSPQREGLLCVEGTGFNSMLVMRDLATGEQVWSQLLGIYRDADISTIQLDGDASSEILMAIFRGPFQVLDSRDGTPKATSLGWEVAPVLSSSSGFWPQAATAQYYVGQLGNDVVRFAVPGFTEHWSFYAPSAGRLRVITEQASNKQVIFSTGVRAYFDAQSGIQSGFLFTLSRDGAATEIADLDRDGYQEVIYKGSGFDHSGVLEAQRIGQGPIYAELDSLTHAALSAPIFDGPSGIASSVVAVRRSADIDASNDLILERIDIASGNSLGQSLIDDAFSNVDDRISLSSDLETGAVTVVYTSLFSVQPIDFGVAAVDALTGERIWERRQADLNDSSPGVFNRIYAEPATRGGLQVVLVNKQLSSFENFVVALDLRTGKKLWGANLMSAFSPIAFVKQPESKQHLFAFTGRDASFVYEAATGALVRQIPFGGEDVRFFDKNGVLDVCIASSQGARCFDVHSGVQTLSTALELNFGRGRDLPWENLTFGNGFDFERVYDLASQTEIELLSPLDKLGTPRTLLRTRCGTAADRCFAIWSFNRFMHLRVSSAISVHGFE